MTVLLLVSANFCIASAFAAESYEILNDLTSVAVSESFTQSSPAPKNISVSGSVVNEDGKPLVGVTVFIKATNIGVITNSNGEFSIKAPNQNSVIIFSSIGFDTKELVLGNRRILTVILKESAQMVEDVVVVGFGTQKKESLVSSITTIRPAKLKGPTSNLTTMIGGQVAGMISYQRSGEPGQDNAEFFIRGVGSFGAGKVNPLILIDGIESSTTDLARLQPDDIADFSVLKDATASAVYGARGANGVVLVNTKNGLEGSTKFNFRAENSFSTNAKNFQFADNITYMQLANEAVLTRNPQSPLTYTNEKIEQTRRGVDPILYPNNDWIDQLIKPYTMNQRFNANLSGGGRTARYYIAGTFNIDNGVLRNDSGNNFNNNISLKNYSIRTNTDLSITKTTVATVRVYAQFDDYKGPVGGGEKIFQSTMSANPVAFPAIYPKSYSPYTNHPMFGSALIPNSTGQLYANPYAQMVSGYQVNNAATINAQIEFKQDFAFLLPGLSARAMGYTQRYSFFTTSRHYNPFYYKSNVTSQGVIITPYNHGSDGSIGTPGTEYLRYTEGAKSVSTAYYGEAVVNYDNTFANKHKVTGMLIGTIRHSLVGNAGTLEASLPSRNLGLSGRFTYGYDSRYLMEFNFGYNGSERFAKDKHWGFFPSIGGGWIISNEKFFGSLKNVIPVLKLRGSYGLVGNDQIGNSSDRFFYLSSIDLDNSERGYVFGKNFQYQRSGVLMKRYANYDIGWEESRQTNIGLDMNIAGINFIIEGYKQTRSNILLDRTYIPGTMGLHAVVAANTGEAKSHGIDVSIDYNKYFKNGLWTTLRGNFTWAKNKITVYDEPQYAPNEYYRSRVGYPFAQTWGYVAERLFVDDQEVINSPTQKFGDIPVAAGDIKYRDINGDKQITEADMIPLGYPTTPEINFGFGGTIGYKSFDLSLFFQGSARSSIFISPGAISPFVMQTGDNAGNQNGLLNVIANDHWSEDSRNLYAFWPRLSDRNNENNTQVSTWWMKNGAMLRLKSVEVGYNLPETIARKIGMTKLRFYVNANNLFVFSKFKLWDPEMGSNGLGYPIQRVFNIGISLGL